MPKLSLSYEQAINLFDLFNFHGSPWTRCADLAWAYLMKNYRHEYYYANWEEKEVEVQDA